MHHTRFLTFPSLGSQITTEYMKSSILYNRILRSRVIPLNNSDTSFSVDINSPSKSLNWLSATGGAGGRPPKRLLPP